jgi:flavin reductase (DIM6/NTAB) family NADH-FMN oxidoreductase RutF
MVKNPVDLEWHRQHRAGEPHRLDPQAYRVIAGRFTTGVTVVTALRGSDGRGMTANAFTSVSLDPLLVLVCVRQDSEMRRLVDKTHQFAVSVLAADQQGVASWFANPARPQGRAQFDSVGWSPGRATGAPVIDGCLAWLECAVAERVPAGDHMVLIGRVLDLGRSAATDPLVFFNGSYLTATSPVSVRTVV